MNEIQLKRTIGLPALLFYGLGTMIGGGFYALLGKMIGAAGVYAPLALLITGLVALINSFSFAELAARFPVSAGEAHYVKAGFNKRSLSVLTGWLVITTGVVSAATLTVATGGFLNDLVGLNVIIGIFLVVLLLGGVAAWGVSESVVMVVIITLIEVGMLLLIFFLEFDNLAELPRVWQESPPVSFGVLFWSIFSTVFLAFYSYIGFEDMVNMAEEVKEPSRNLAIAIPVCVVLATVLYVAVSLVAVASPHLAEFASSQTPLAVILGNYGSVGLIAVGIVSILTGLNGALVQIIMASRVAYGLAKQQQAPAVFGYVNSKTQTPVYATLLMMAIVLLLALFFPMKTLAQVTSGILLVVFAMVNLALWRIKKMQSAEQYRGPSYPEWVPLVGFMTCCVLIVGRLYMIF